MLKEYPVLGFRLVYRDLVLAGSLTTVFRPDLPKYGKLFKPGSVVPARIIAQPGSGRSELVPVYTADQITLRIKSCERRALHKLKPADFRGSSPDVHDALSLAYHLGLIYNLPANDFTTETRVVRIEVEYLSINQSRGGL